MYTERETDSGGMQIERIIKAPQGTSCRREALWGLEHLSPISWQLGRDRFRDSDKSISNVREALNKFRDLRQPFSDTSSKPPSWFTNTGTISSKLRKVTLESFRISVVNHTLGESIIDMYVRKNKSSIQRPIASHLQEEAAVKSPVMK